jgi:hypothetical protein
MERNTKGGSKKITKGMKAMQGRLSKLAPEERSAIASLGGRASQEARREGKYLQRYSKCAGCRIRLFCAHAYDEYNQIQARIKALEGNNPNNVNIARLREFKVGDSRCRYELSLRDHDKQRDFELFEAFVGGTPEKMMAEMARVYSVMDNKACESPSFGKLINLYYMLIKVYELKYGPRSSKILVSNHIQSGSPNSDIKALMADMRRGR